MSGVPYGRWRRPGSWLGLHAFLMLGQAQEHVLQRHGHELELEEAPVVPDRTAGQVFPQVAPELRLDQDRVAFLAHREHAGEGQETFLHVGRGTYQREAHLLGSAETGRQLFLGVLGHDPAVVDDDHALGDRRGFGQDVGAQDDGTRARQVADQLPDFDDLFRVEPDRRLVQDEDRRVVDEGLGQPDPLLEAAGEVGDQPAPRLAQRHPLQDLVEGHRQAFRLDVLDPPDEGQVLGDRHLGVERQDFRQIADQAFDLLGLVEAVVAVDLRGAGRGRQGGRQDAHRGGLAGPVRTQKGQDLPFVHGEADVGDGGLGTVELGQMLDLDHGCGKKPLCT